MQQKKFASLGMALVMLSGLLAACSNDNGNKENTAPSSTAATPSEGTYADYSQGFAETVSLDIPVYERAFEGWNVKDNYYTRWIQKEFGDKYNIKLNFVPIARSNEVTDFEQLLAAHKAPDVIFHYDMPQALAYYGEEVLQPLDLNEIKNYAPTYWANMGETIQQYGNIDGENVFFFAARPDTDNFVTLIRKDWVEKVGMKVEDLTSLEKYNEMLGKWKEAGLGVGGAALTRNSYNFSYAYRDWPIDSEYRALYSDLAVADFTTKDAEAWLRNLNYEYNNGLIDKEFYLRDDDNKTKAEFVAGRTGTYGFYLTNNTDLFSAALKNNPTAEFAVLPPEALVPEGNVPQGRAYWPFGFIMGVNYESTAEERAALWMYLEWMSQPDNLFYLQNGVEGQNYTLDADGLPVKNADYTGESALSLNNNKDYWALVTETQAYGSPELTLKANMRNWSPAGYEDIAEDMVRYYNETAEYRTPDALFTVVLEELNEYKADLNSLFQELYLEVVLAPESEFDKKYEAAKKKFLDAGYQDILDEKQQAIDAGQYR
ncbi:type 2 periplasmic-binding domain-containing protein [Cohnella fermenti]|uniref:ABC transporter substrate-binding protein n=1 Tax=Cohnella fermenti TaxID=2565925 RepID=A0A4S4C5X9_9BACL|nr:extracellular solute-binding protein [Cohnella fermenti]THF82653.1 ABC transporter substrate-binding protein [Cohnella fermenti]